VFNTGQVILGWLSAYEETSDEDLARATCRAGDFMVKMMDPDGLWRRGTSSRARSSGSLYQARAAWALAEAGDRLDRRDYLTAAHLNLRATARLQAPNGWLDNCCLDDPTRPLLHTLAYAIRGLLEGGRLFEDDQLIGSAATAARALADSVEPNGQMPGRYFADWTPAVRWSCLTGQAQMANVWLRLCEITGERDWLDPVQPVIRFLEGTQNCKSRYPGIRGGIQGSKPVWGEYGKYQLLNWATKFFADALLRWEVLGKGEVPTPITITPLA
jgi:uncharacterized protein YyaL (SSP411 family)